MAALCCFSVIQQCKPWSSLPVKMYTGDSAFCFATGLWNARTGHSWETPYSWKSPDDKMENKGKGLYFSEHGLEISSCSQITITSSVTGERGNENIKSLLALVLDWAQAHHQSSGYVIMGNTEYNNTQHLLFGNSEEAQNSAASFAKGYCWSTWFWVAIAAVTILCLCQRG